MVRAGTRPVSGGLIAVFDAGTASGRCLLIDAHGHVHARAQERWIYDAQPFEGNVLWSFRPAQMWEHALRCFRMAAGQVAEQASSILGIIVSSQRHGAVVMGSDGQALLGFPNADERTTPSWQALSAQHGEAIYHITGRWPQNVFLPAHLDWLRAHDTEVWERLRYVLGIQDWLVYQLCGELVSEPSIATDLLLLDIQTRGWSQDLLDFFGVEAGWLPPLAAAGVRVGSLHESVAAACGLPPGIPVFNGGADSQLGLLGLGATEAGDLGVLLGSSAPLQIVLDTPRLSPDAATWTNCHIFPSQWVLESNAGDAGVVLDHFLQQFQGGDPDTGQNGKETGWPSFRELDQKAHQLELDQCTVFASVGPIIFHGRDWPHVRGRCEGLVLSGPGAISTQQFYRALLENIAFAVRGNLEQLVKVYGPIASLRAGGAAMDSPLWQRLLPDVLGRPLLAPQQSEITSMGAAILAACGLGLHSDTTAAIKAMVHLQVIEPQREAADWYAVRYGKWLDVYRQSLDATPSAHLPLKQDHSHGNVVPD